MLTLTSRTGKKRRAAPAGSHQDILAHRYMQVISPAVLRYIYDKPLTTRHEQITNQLDELKARLDAQEVRLASHSFVCGLIRQICPLVPSGAVGYPASGHKPRNRSRGASQRKDSVDTQLAWRCSRGQECWPPGGACGGGLQTSRCLAVGRTISTGPLPSPVHTCCSQG